MKALLEGPATSDTQGLSLSESNFSAALELLHFGQTQQKLSSHIQYSPTTTSHYHALSRLSTRAPPKELPCATA